MPIPRGYFYIFIVFGGMSFTAIPSESNPIKIISSNTASPRLVSVEMTQQAQLCGINCLYLFLGLFGGYSKYDDILASFPDAKTKGTSLLELAQFLEMRKFWTSVEMKSERELAADRSHAGIVLLQSGKFYHFVLKRSFGEAGIQLLDAPLEPVYIEHGALSNESVPTLVVSTKKEPVRVFILKNRVYIGVSAIVIGILVVSLSCWKKIRTLIQQ